MEDNHSSLLSSPLLSFPLLPSTLLSLKTSKHSINLHTTVFCIFLSFVNECGCQEREKGGGGGDFVVEAWTVLKIVASSNSFIVCLDKEV